MKHIFTGLNLKGAIALPDKWWRAVKIFNEGLERGATQMRRFGCTILVAALFTGSVATALADAAPLAGVSPGSSTLFVLVRKATPYRDRYWKSSREQAAKS